MTTMNHFLAVWMPRPGSCAAQTCQFGLNQINNLDMFSFLTSLEHGEARQTKEWLLREGKSLRELA